MDKITVVVPFYNVEAYFEECINSLVSQTYSHIEILCIDDSSKDDSIKIAKSYANKDDRIRIIKHERNIGLGGGRNTGIKHATGKYICFVDSDDYVSERFIELLHKIIKSDESDMAICGYWCVDNSRLKKCHHELTPVKHNINNDNLVHIIDSYRSAAWFKMYRRRVLIENNIIQPEKTYYEDVLFWVKSVYYSCSISVIPDRLYFYRQRHNSIMTTLSYKHLEDRVEFITNIYSFLQEKLTAPMTGEAGAYANNIGAYIMKHIIYGITLIDESDTSKKHDYYVYYSGLINDFCIQAQRYDFLDALELHKYSL